MQNSALLQQFRQMLFFHLSIISTTSPSGRAPFLFGIKPYFYLITVKGSFQVFGGYKNIFLNIISDYKSITHPGHIDSSGNITLVCFILYFPRIYFLCSALIGQLSRISEIICLAGESIYSDAFGNLFIVETLFRTL